MSEKNERVTARAAMVAAALAVAAGSAVGVTVLSAGAALAPEPARLTADLVGTTGATAASVYVYSQTQTTILKWPGWYVSSANPPAVGTPCSTTDLANGWTTTKVIQGAGSYRRCY